MKTLLLTSTFLLSFMCYGSDRKQTEHAVNYLTSKYNSAQILILATPNHTQSGFYRIIRLFLESVIEDENLKYIVLERPKITDEYLQHISLQNPGDFTPSNVVSKEVLCGSTEWAFVANSIFPIIQKSNQERSNKILLRAIDSMNEKREAPENRSKLPIVTINECFNYDEYQPYEFVVSYNREVETSQNFEKDIVNNLKPNEKVILIYNYAHLLEGVTSCKPTLNDGIYYQRDLLTSWLGIYLDKFPSQSDSMKSVLFDEEDVITFDGKEYPGYNEYGILNLNFDHSKLQSFDLDGFGEDLHNSSVVNQLFYGLNFSTDTVFDGYVWIPDSRDFPFVHNDSAHYLPQMCKESD